MKVIGNELINKKWLTMNRFIKTGRQLSDRHESDWQESDWQMKVTDKWKWLTRKWLTNESDWQEREWQMKVNDNKVNDNTVAQI